MLADCCVPPAGVGGVGWSTAENVEQVGWWVQLVADAEGCGTGCEFVFDGGVGVEEVGVVFDPLFPECVLVEELSVLFFETVHL